MELPHSLEQLTPGRIQDRLARQDQRHLFARSGQLRQPPQRPLRIGPGLDAVVPGVALDELSLDLFERFLVFVDGEENGKRSCLFDGGWRLARRIKADGVTASRREGLRSRNAQAS